MNTLEKSDSATGENLSAELALPSGGGWNIAGDAVAAGIEKNRPEFRDDLQFAYEFAHRQRWAMKETAEHFGVDITTLSRVFRGEYRSAAKNSVLPPPPAMLSIIREIRATELAVAHKRAVLVRTPTVERIHLGMRKAWDQHSIMFLWGESHLGKTESALWFRDDNNHGATVYVDLQDCYGVQDVWRAFARALHLSADCGLSKLIPRIYAALKPPGVTRSRRFIIVDEFHTVTYTYQRRSTMRIVNVIKAIKDNTGGGMLVIGTPTAREALYEGEEKQYLKQLLRRGMIEMNMGPAIPVPDIRAWAAHYQLDFPTAQEMRERVAGKVADKEAGKDTWKNLQIAYPHTPHLFALDEIAWKFGTERLAKTFEDAQHLAAKARRGLQWSDFTKAHNIYSNLAQMTEV